MASRTQPYPTNRAYRRLVLLQLFGCVFYFAVLRATEHGMPGWPAARALCARGDRLKLPDKDEKPPQWLSDTLFAIVMGGTGLGLVAATGCAVVAGLAAAIAAMLSGVLSAAYAFVAGGPGVFARSHRYPGAVVPVFVAEAVFLCAIVFGTFCFCTGHPFTDYLLGAYALTVVLYAPIWSAASTFMDLRNDRWVASVVRQCTSAVDPEVRRLAEAKLANLGPWASK